MAECASAASCIKLHLRRECLKQRSFDKKLCFRRHCHRDSDLLYFSPRKIHGLRMGSPKTRLDYLQKQSGCHCLGSLVDFDGATAPELVTIVDQALLMASIILTYMAGVIPVERRKIAPQNIVSGNNGAQDGTALSGSDTKIDYHAEECAWDVIKRKLLASLETIQLASVSGEQIDEQEKLCARKPLSLHAIAHGPRLRLLWDVLMHLEKEVYNIPEGFQTATPKDWLVLFSRIIQSSSHPVCMTWLYKELSKENGDVKEALVSSTLEKLEADSAVLQNIKKSGKEDLLAELLYFLKFGYLRKDCYYNTCLFVSHSISVLEDLVITIADGIASIYLELISIDGNLSNQINNLDLSLCSLSTRALQRLRNEVALNLWLHQNMEAVVSMYEDRFDLYTLQSHFIDESSKNAAENLHWWDIFPRNKSQTRTSSLHYVIIGHFSMPVKRTKELRALTGWRYYFSLFLELSDITMPLIRTFFKKVSDAISFFLVCLIGRSLGLIYTGIRQSLRWK